MPYGATEADLRAHFSGVGPPSQIVIPVDRETGRPRGFAFVEFLDRGIAEQAIERFNQQPFMGRTLSVSEARPRDDRGPGGPPRGPGGPGGGFSSRPPGGGGFGGPRPAAPGEALARVPADPAASVRAARAWLRPAQHATSDLPRKR